MEQIKTLNAEICVSRLTNFKALLSDLNFSVDIQSQTIFKRIIQAKNIQIKQIKASTKSFIEKQNTIKTIIYQVLSWYSDNNTMLEDFSTFQKVFKSSKYFQLTRN